MRLVYDFEGRETGEKKVALNKLKVSYMLFSNLWAAIVLSTSSGCLSWSRKKQRAGATWETV
jgi:hypothetical protein